MAIYNLQAKVMKTALLTMLITAIATSETYAAGRTAKSIANTVLSGAGVPAKSLGIDGDFYIDTKSMNMYGPKKKNSWPLPVSLRGPQGPAGIAGSDGKNASTSSVSAGAAGADPALKERLPELLVFENLRLPPGLVPVLINCPGILLFYTNK